MNIQIPFKSEHVLKITLGLLLVDLVFVGVYTADFLLAHPFWQVCELFDLDREANIPTWFSTLQLFLTGLIALTIALQKDLALPSAKRVFAVLGFGFIYLSMDEASAIHEKITYAFYDNPLVPYFEGMHGVWVFVYGLLGILITLFLHKDLIVVFKKFRRASLLFIAGIIVYLAGSGGAETITFFQLDKTDRLVYTIEVIVEEFLEMAGATLILGSLLWTLSSIGSNQN